MKYRSRVDIISDILLVLADGPKKKTVIMYGAKLSFPQLEEYEAFLLKRGLMEHTGEAVRKGRLYSITPLGRELVQLHARINQIVPVKDRGPGRPKKVENVLTMMSSARPNPSH
jgi:predicted transcriptional regulator